MATLVKILILALFHVRGVMSLEEQESERIFGDIIANYNPESNNNQRKFCLHGNCPDTDDEVAENDVEHPDRSKVDAHKYQAKHQKKYLYPKHIDDKLRNITVPQMFKKVRRAMKKCGLDMSKDTITVEEATKLLPTAEKQESLRQNVRTMEDQQRMKSRLESWSRDRPKAAVYFTVLPGRNRVSTIKSFLKNLHENFLAEFDYPVIVFHEPDFSISLQDEIKRTAPKIDLYFQLVKFQVPRWIKEPMPQWVCRYDHGIGYRHWTRFQSKLVYDQPILEGLAYALSLDAESHIDGPIKFDVFGYMQEHNLLLGYISPLEDDCQCVCKLWESVRKYTEVTKLEPKFFHELSEAADYCGSFEISSLKLWRSLKYQHFIDYVDQLGGIYYYGWTNGVIKSLAASLFVPRNQTHEFTSQDVKIRNY